MSTSIDLRSRASGLALTVVYSGEGPATLALRAPGQPDSGTPAQPLVEALAAGHGRNWAGPRYATTQIGQRLRYTGHTIDRTGSWQTLRLSQTDMLTDVQFTSELSIHDDHLGLRSTTHVHNASTETFVLHAVTSMVFADFGLRSGDDIDAMTILRGHSDWLAEGRWTQKPLREAGLPVLTFPGLRFRTRGCIEAVSLSSWPTAAELPTVVLGDTRSGYRWSFQIEHNGAWVWQVGELADGLYVALLGPTDEHHSWNRRLAPGESFDTVPASVAVEPLVPTSSSASLTAFRRQSARPGVQARLPIVFNDYMNTVNGDPSAAVLHPLIDAAAAAGSDVFVVDAGWYADDGDWWDSVGEWQPSTRRFPNGLDDVLSHIRRAGMVAGLWMEAEVVGVNSPMTLKLPADAFLQRDGVRVVEHGRFHLDFTCEATTRFLNEVVDRLVNDHRVGYFKFDYNIRAGVGTDARKLSPGDGLLRHNRAYLAWVDALRVRHPDLVLENCASGGMRQDMATVSRFDLQSTSDQENLHAYAPVAASAAMLVPPEKAANWAYPQPHMSDQDITFTLCTAMLGQFYLSGWLDHLAPAQSALVRNAVTAHRNFADRIAHCTPFWPAGLPGWDDEWLAFGLHDRDRTQVYLTVWRRGTAPGSAELALPQLPPACRWAAPEAVFPAESPLLAQLAPDATTLAVTDDAGIYAARVVTLHAEHLDSFPDA